MSGPWCISPIKTSKHSFNDKSGTTAYIKDYPIVCPYAVAQYLWLNTLHVTYPMHDLFATEMIELFEA